MKLHVAPGSMIFEKIEHGHPHWKVKYGSMLVGVIEKVAEGSYVITDNHGNKLCVSSSWAHACGVAYGSLSSRIVLKDISAIQP